MEIIRVKKRIIKTLRGYKPLVYWKDELLLAHGFQLVLADLALTRFRPVATLPSTPVQRLMVKLRLASRLFRLEVGPACDLMDGQNIIVSQLGKIYRVNLDSGKIKYEFSLPHGGRPLALTRVNVSGFAQGVYMGEYFSNASKGDARIFYRDITGRWATIHTFLAGTINHVHNIVPDPARECVYVLTGDFGDAACIWRARDGFQSIERLTEPGQNSRACWLQIETDHLLYATDTQLETNHLNKIPLDRPGTTDTQSLQVLGGSSIYRAETPSGTLVFSTAVEPDQVRGNKYIEIFSRRRGAGIQSENAHVYAGHSDTKLQPIFSAPKDFWPFRLFQFGSFQFPAGQCPSSEVTHTYATALKGVDGCTLLLDIATNT